MFSQCRMTLPSAVVTELRAALVGEHSSASQSARVKAEVAVAVKGRAENVEVHRLYLEGKFFLERQTSEDIMKGIGLLERAVDRDPTYALAWAALSRAYVVRSWIPRNRRVSPPTFDLARAAAEHALTCNLTCLRDTRPWAGSVCWQIGIGMALKNRWSAALRTRTRARRRSPLRVIVDGQRRPSRRGT
jgi:hypothetical protein